MLNQSVVFERKTTLTSVIKIPSMSFNNRSKILLSSVRQPNELVHFSKRPNGFWLPAALQSLISERLLRDISSLRYISNSNEREAGRTPEADTNGHLVIFGLIKKKFSQLARD